MDARRKWRIAAHGANAGDRGRRGRSSRCGVCNIASARAASGAHGRPGMQATRQVQGYAQGSEGAEHGHLPIVHLHKSSRSAGEQARPRGCVVCANAHRVRIATITK